LFLSLAPAAIYHELVVHTRLARPPASAAERALGIVQLQVWPLLMVLD